MDVGNPLVCVGGDGQISQTGINIGENFNGEVYIDVRNVIGWIDSVISNDRTTPPPTTKPTTTTRRPGARPLVEGSIHADTIGQTVGSFFDFMSSLFEYLDDKDDKRHH